MEATMKRVISTAVTACAVAGLSLAAAPIWAQRQNPPATAGQSTSANAAAKEPRSLPDQELGRRIMVRPEDLPPPKTGPVVSNRSLTLPFEGQTPRVPPGFTADGGDFAAMVKAKKVQKFSLTQRQVILYLGRVAPGQKHSFTWSLKPKYPLRAKGTTKWSLS